MQRGRHQPVVRDPGRILEILTADDEVASGLWPHRLSDVHVGEGDEPGGAQGAPRPGGLALEVPLECVDACSCLLDRGDRAGPRRVSLRPAPVGECHVPALDLDDDGAAIRHEHEQIDLDLAVHGIGESNPVEKDVAVTKVIAETLPDDALRIVLESRMLWNQSRGHSPSIHVVGSAAGPMRERLRAALLRDSSPLVRYGRACGRTPSPILESMLTGKRPG